jgi:hypothetical protein
MISKGSKATLIATTVALMFLGSVVRAADEKPATGTQSQVKCVGGNSCSGQSACKTASSSCKGQNSCKGKGWISTADAKACTTVGGHVEASAK